MDKMSASQGQQPNQTWYRELPDPVGPNAMLQTDTRNPCKCSQKKVSAAGLGGQVKPIISTGRPVVPLLCSAIFELRLGARAGVFKPPTSHQVTQTSSTVTQRGGPHIGGSKWLLDLRMSQPGKLQCNANS